uniref:Uncharacterized protein n=1 Tax=Plectus sambesii TaxID=2011161 RepID=A0A914W1X1_9BILA
MLRCLLLLVCVVALTWADSKCVWATGKLVCQKDQKLVLNATVELYDLDGPQEIAFLDHLDPDDKMGFTFISNADGIFTVEGCGSDTDIIPGLPNTIEPYLRIHHFCNSPAGEEVDILPTFNVFVPETYDYHMKHPIVLDWDAVPESK